MTILFHFYVFFIFLPSITNSLQHIIVIYLDEKDVNETIGFIEAKQMARDAMTQPAVTASVSSYKSSRKTIKRPSGKINCNICGKISIKFTWSRKLFQAKPSTYFKK